METFQGVTSRDKVEKPGRVHIGEASKLEVYSREGLYPTWQK